MLTPLHEVLDLLMRLGASYADVRHVETERENLRVRNDEVEGLHQVRDAGYGLRVLVDGAWGFSSSARGTREALERAAREAIEIARAAARIAKDRVSLAPSSPAKGSYRTRVLRDPFAVPIEEKLELLFSATRILRADPRVRAARGSMTFVRQRKHLVSSEGHDVAQDITISGGGIAAVAVEGTDAQSRSYPKDGEGDIAQAGYEFVVGLELAGNAERVREEAIALLSAPDCPAGAKTLVLTGSQLSLQVHESCGHPTELDRALGTELSLAGGSFLTPDRLGMRYGASHVHMVAEATTPGAPGSFGWDDEGTPAQRVDLVRGGEFVGYLSSRETAARIGATSSGSVRAESWNRVPLIRMVNVNLEPGPTGTRLDDLVADTDDGLLLDVNRAWSIDDRRLNFQFGVEAAWELKHGRRTRLLRNTIYTGITPRFWQSCDAIAGPDDWRMWGWMFCGKGDPMQVIWVGHGVSAARFRSVDVGSRR
jgi:TldD protein